MEWLLPVIFVVVSLLQWWLKHRQTIKDSSETKPRSAPDHREIADPFSEMGDLLEALGRGRHETSPAIPSRPAARVIEAPAILPTPSLSNLPMPEQAILQSALAKSPLSRPLKPRKEAVQLGHYWRRKLGQPSSMKEAVVLSEILALPVALR